MNRLPFGAWKILEARKKGRKPADMVLVSMIGKLDELNPVVQASPGVHHDWSWARDLVLCFWATPKEYEPSHILDCAKAKPRAMYLWDFANQKGYNLSVLPTVESIERPLEQWDWKVDADRWMEFQERHFASGSVV